MRLILRRSNSCIGLLVIASAFRLILLQRMRWPLVHAISIVHVHLACRTPWLLITIQDFGYLLAKRGRQREQDCSVAIRYRGRLIESQDLIIELQNQSVFCWQNNWTCKQTQNDPWLTLREILTPSCVSFLQHTESQSYITWNTYTCVHEFCAKAEGLHVFEIVEGFLNRYIYPLSWRMGNRRELTKLKRKFMMWKPFR